MELSVKHMQITLCRDNEHMIGLEDQSFRDQIDRHRCVAWEYLVEHGGYGSQVINDDDGDPHITR
jgi:hypothetical protein